ncbi:NADP-dependent oxidoreductase domain-containing protein [Lanmaoa asiatica]|nr:NADP-dependent oxidoreductase domain-containing protein [Lanmaoa asiatica]
MVSYLRRILVVYLADVNPGKENVQHTSSSTPSYRDSVLLIQVQFYLSVGEQFLMFDPRFSQGRTSQSARSISFSDRVLSSVYMFYATQVHANRGTRPQQTDPYNAKDAIKDQIAASLRTSLRNLRTFYIDSYLLHSPLRTMQATLEAWRALMAAQGRRDRELRKVQVVQNRWYEGNMWDPDVWMYCRDHGMEYQAFWTLSGSASLLAHPAVITIAGRLEVTPAQVIFKLAQLQSIVPLTGTTNGLHMQQDLAAERITFREDVDSEIRNITKFIWGR